MRLEFWNGFDADAVEIRGTELELLVLERISDGRTGGVSILSGELSDLGENASDGAIDSTVDGDDVVGVSAFSMVAYRSVSTRV